MSAQATKITHPVSPAFNLSRKNDTAVLYQIIFAIISTIQMSRTFSKLINLTLFLFVYTYINLSTDV